MDNSKKTREFHCSSWDISGHSYWPMVVDKTIQRSWLLFPLAHDRTVVPLPPWTWDLLQPMKCEQKGWGSFKSQCIFPHVLIPLPWWPANVPVSACSFNLDPRVRRTWSRARHKKKMSFISLKFGLPCCHSTAWAILTENQLLSSSSLKIPVTVSGEGYRNGHRIRPCAQDWTLSSVSAMHGGKPHCPSVLQVFPQIYHPTLHK